MNWYMYIVVAIVLFTLSNIFARGFQSKIHPLYSMIVLILTSFIVTCIGIYFTKVIAPKQLVISKEGVVLAISAGLAWGIGQLSWFYTLGVAPVSIALPLVTGGVTLLGVLSGILFFKEVLSPVQIVGIFVTLAGSILLCLPK